MTLAKQLATRFDNAVNPIVIKELRQAIGGRFLPAVLMLFLVFQLFAMAISVWAYRADRDLIGGREVFLWLEGALMVTCLLFLPLYTGLRLNSERSDSHTDLLFISTLRPRSIILGKFLATLALAVMLFSACTPFLAMTYLLRGIDLPTIFTILSIDFLIVAVCVMATIFIAAIPAKRGLKFLLGLGVLFGLLSALSMKVSMTFAIITFGIASLFGTVTGVEFWVVLGLFLFFLTLAMGLAVVLSVAMISPPSSNRALYSRAYMTLLWLATLGSIAAMGVYYRTALGILPWAIVTMGLLGLGLLVAVSERDQWGPRVIRAIPSNAALRIPAFFFYSGSAGGILWTLAMGGLTLGVFYAALLITQNSTSASNFEVSAFREVFGILTMLTLYTIAYALTAYVIRRRLLQNFLHHTNTYVMALLLAAAGSFLPLIISLMMPRQSFDFWEKSAWSLTVPFMVLEGKIDPMRWGFVSVWAGGIFLIILPGLVTQWVRFCRMPTPSPQPPLPQAVNHG